MRRVACVGILGRVVGHYFGFDGICTRCGMREGR